MAIPKQHVQLFAETLPLAYMDLGAKAPTILLLHGGAGTLSVVGLAHALAKTHRVIVPTHPGFDGEPRPEFCDSPRVLAMVYLALLDKLQLDSVLVVGSSMGGWVAAEMAWRNSASVKGAVLINAAGVEPSGPEQTIVDPSKLAPPERLVKVFFDPVKFAPPAPTPESLKVMAANQQALQAYAIPGAFMFDPLLKPRLGLAKTPCLVIWGANDQIIPEAYGREFAKCIPAAQFALVNKAGHLPHIEQTEEVLRLLGEFEVKKCGQ